MQTKVVTVDKLEFVELPANATRRCYAPQPPLEGGILRYEVLPEYSLFLLNVIEQCNQQLQQIKQIEQESVGREEEEKERE